MPTQGEEMNKSGRFISHGEAESETADPVAAAAQQSAPAADGAERTRVVKGFEEITALLAAAPLPGAEPSEAG